MGDGIIDVKSRDPNQINEHVKCRQEDVLAEPDGAHSFDCVWKLSVISYIFWRDCYYRLVTLLCGVCMGAQWGCIFASTALCHVWFYTPLYKGLALNCGYLKKLYLMCLDCCCKPWFEMCALIFSTFSKGR